LAEDYDEEDALAIKKAAMSYKTPEEVDQLIADHAKRTVRQQEIQKLAQQETKKEKSHKKHKAHKEAMVQLEESSQLD
jgi:predicted S18 family serine protease